jgi:hypothetical protein
MSGAATPRVAGGTRDGASAAIAELRRVRVWLAAGVALRALLWAAATALAGLALIALADAVRPIPLAGRRGLLAADCAAALAVAAALIVRDRHALHLDAVALWIEEHVPDLRFTLISEFESRGQLRLVDPATLSRWPRLVGSRVSRALVRPFIAALVLAVVLALLPGGTRARAAMPHPGDSLERVALGAASSNPLAQIVVEVTPPAYAHRSAERFDDPITVRALRGSRVSVTGRRGEAEVSAQVSRGSRGPLISRLVGGQWTIQLQVPDSAAALELSAGAHRRVLDLEPERDAPPSVVLRYPARDTVRASAHGTVALTAGATDDIGLAEVHFEIVISSGEGENFAFRTLTVGARRLATTETVFDARISLDSLALRPGDVMHVRAVAADGNTLSGPGVGTSETRVLRIARAGADDSLAITPAAPPDTNQSALSERMLIQLTEALARRRTVIPRRTLLSEAHGIAADQQRLRRNVGDLVFSRLGGQPSSEDAAADQPRERGDSMRSLLARADRATSQSIQTLDFDGGETPVVAVNRPLLEAYNAMWDAGGALEQGELDKALPHMRAALDAIERSRRAERVYLRGRAPDVVVDVAKARLQGKGGGSSSTRTSRPASDSARERLERRYSRMLATRGLRGPALADSLLMLRVDALATAPDLAAALGQAAEAVRRGRAADAANALLHARRALAGAPVVTRSLGPWGIAP